MNRIKAIQPTDSNAAKNAEAQWNSIAKPLHSFGLLEEAVQKLAAIQKSADVCINHRTAVILCADHGVVDEGTTQCGQEVTAICAKAIAEGRSNVNALADSCGAEVIAVDIGMRNPVHTPKLINRRIADGTRNFTLEPAMTEIQAEKALICGMDLVQDLKTNRCSILLAGEMGIGNTTSASAIASVILNLPVETVTGRGAGLSDDGLKRKISAIRRGIELHKPSSDKPLHLLRTLGGLEIAGMTGLFLGAAYYQIPIVIDGLISSAAAAIAYQMNPLCAEYMFASHCSGEPAASGLLAQMHLKPVIDAQLRLGEGTGALLLLPLLDGALAIYRNAHRFDEESIERYRELC